MSSPIQVFQNYYLNDIHGYTVTNDYGYDERRNDYREVFETTKNNKKYIIKIGRLNHSPDDLNLPFEQETELCQKLYKMKLAPEIIEKWQTYAINKETNKKIQVLCIVMHKWSTTYGAFKIITQDPEIKIKISENLYQLIYSPELGILPRFHKETEMIHGDMHADNVLLNVNEKGIPYEATLIDFECAKSTKNQEIIEQIYPFWHCMSHVYPTIEAYELGRLHCTSIYNSVAPFVTIF